MSSESEKETKDNSDMKNIIDEIAVSLTKMNMESNVDAFIDNDVDIPTEDPELHIDDPVMIVKNKIEQMKQTEALEVKDDSNDEDDDVEEVIPTITKHEALNMINSLCEYLVRDTDDNRKLLYYLRRKVNNMTYIQPKPTQQQTLDMYCNKNTF